MKQKGFIPIIILIFVIVLVAVGYFSYKSYTSQKGQNIGTYSPLPKASAFFDQTANWKTYTNTQYGFSFKYPADLQVVLGYSDTPGNIGVLINKDDLSNSIKKEEFDINTLENILVPNSTLSFKKAKFERAYNGFVGFLELDSGKTLLIDKMISTGINDERINAEFDQILSTFKFTDTQSNLKTYYSQNLDISFDYPGDWNLTSGSYIGDMALGEFGGCDYVIKNFPGYLKNESNCSDQTLKSATPGITITSPDGKNKIQFAGPTSGLGGGCPECIDNPKTEFNVKGKTYSINTVKMPSGTLYETLIGPDRVGIATGPKSIWNKFDIYLSAQDKSTFDLELGILKSIK